MKTMKHIPWMLLAVLAFATACTQDELTDTTTNAGTGTVDGNWVEGDEITVLFQDLYATKATYTYTNGGFTSDNPIDCNGQTAYAQAWTNYGVTPNLYNGAPGQWEVKTDQSGIGYRQSDFLNAGTQSHVGAGTPANFTFYHQTAKIVVHVRNSGIVAGKTELSMKVGNDNIYIDGELVSQVNNVYIWTSGETKGTITPYTLGQQPMSDRTTSLVSFGALVIPQTIDEGNTLFTFTVDGQTYTYTVPTGGITWENGKEYTYNVTLKNPDVTTRSTYTQECELELIEVEDMNK